MPRGHRPFTAGIATALVVACGTNQTESHVLASPHAAPLVVSSPAFAAGATIPTIYTCEGDEASPPLRWGDAPTTTKSFTIVVDDPDAPGGTYVHWLVYDLPPEVTELDAAADASLPGNARHGTNSAEKVGWTGPCPPSGSHRYFLKVYALDAVLGDLGDPDKTTLERAMRGHVLAKGELIGMYEKTVSS